MSELFDKIFGSFPEMRLMKEELMAKHTTFRIGGPAEVYACPNQEQLPALLEAAKKENAEVTVIGNGSNLLVGDKGIRGLVIEIAFRMLPHFQSLPYLQEDIRLYTPDSLL